MPTNWNLLLASFFFGFGVPFLIPLYKVFCQENNVYHEHCNVHKCRRVCRQHQAVYYESDTANRIYNAGFDLISRQKRYQNDCRSNDPQPLVLQNLNKRYSCKCQIQLFIPPVSVKLQFVVVLCVTTRTESLCISLSFCIRHIHPNHLRGLFLHCGSSWR